MVQQGGSFCLHLETLNPGVTEGRERATPVSSMLAFSGEEKYYSREGVSVSGKFILSVVFCFAGWTSRDGMGWDEVGLVHVSFNSRSPHARGRAS